MALVAKTQVKTSDALMAKLPKGRGATVEVAWADGSSLRETVEIAEGDADRPLSRASLERKFTNLATSVLGGGSAKRVVALVDNLDELKDIRGLMKALRGQGKQQPT
jgi:2-methylcitrate dehydratase